MTDKRPSGAYVAQPARPSTVARILKLNDDAVGVGEEELRRVTFCTAQPPTTHSHPRDQGARCADGVTSGLHAVLRKGLLDPVRIESIHRETHLCDARRRAGCRAAIDAKALRSGSDAQHRHRSMLSLHRRSKERLIEAQGTLLVRNAKREALEVAHNEHALEGRYAWTPVAKDSGSAAIAQILKLEANPVGIVDVEFRCPLVRAAALRTARPDPRL